MKKHPPSKDLVDKAPLGQGKPAQRDPPPEKGPEYALRVSYYCTMKPQRVYPLVVEVTRGKAAVPAEGPTGVLVTLRPVVPGALVVPAELPLEVSRPGAKATFHVTPLARGRLPEASVRVLCNGRQMQELPMRMTAKTQRLAWALLLLALVLPALLLHYTRYEPLRGKVTDTRTKFAPGNKPEQEDTREEYLREGTPGEVLRDRLRFGLEHDVPEFSGSRRVFGGLGSAVGAVYDALCGSALLLRPAFWLGLVLLGLAFGSWALHRPTRVRGQGSLVLAGVPSLVTLCGDKSAETLPLAQPP
ncbi:MAG TPA: hypothetical protein VKA46_00905 [Gemmataceae bacterium]|nr:hypothetical protein [Gemmataceae bacterium]